MEQSDETRFESFALGYVESMYRLAYSRVGNAEDAQDIVQETFIKAYKSFNSFNKETSFKSWITRILINTTCDHFRKRSRTVSTVDLTETVETVCESSDPGPEEQLCHMEIDPTISVALKSIPEKFLLPLLLREIDSASYEEIANLLEIPMGTVMSRLSRARKQLRLKLLEIDPNYHVETGT